MRKILYAGRIFLIIISTTQGCYFRGVVTPLPNNLEKKYYLAHSPCLSRYEPVLPPPNKNVNNYAPGTTTKTTNNLM